MERYIENFNDKWAFSKLPKEGGFFGLPVEKADFDDSAWERVNLPHTWNDKDGASGRTGICEGGEHYYRGLSCYRKAFVPAAQNYAGKRIFIEFGAANTVAEVYLNGTFVGKHEGGYSAFRFDITEYVKVGEENRIVVKVNNAPTDYIAPITDQGDFTKMGGLYRDVKLIAVEPVHMDLLDYASSGVYITPQNISDKKADVKVCVKLANDEPSNDKKVTVTTKITDMQNALVALGQKDVCLGGNDKASALLELEVIDPMLWDGCRNPYLYCAEVTVSDGEKELDCVEERFGIRSYHVDAEKGFFLNGSYYDLHGVNYHQDSCEQGWAMTDAQRTRDYEMMRELGCTAVRMAHYQHAPFEYDLCDRLGLAVWTEIGIVNKMSADDSDAHALAAGFSENAKQQLRELIRQNYNHPSIVVWGISNELYQMSDEIYALYEELYALAKEEDSSRLKTFADSQFWGRFLELPGDVVGYNRYFGWYQDAGPAEQFGAWLDLYHETKETRAICVSEYGGGGAISQHKDNIDWKTEIDPWGVRHYENYQSEMHEKIWAQFAARPYLWGKFIWCMFDFASDGRQEGDTRGQNDKGLATRERVPKDAYYFYKSVWNPEPMVHLTEQRFSQRPCHVPAIKAYANGERAELWVNGESYGGIRREELPEDFRTVYVWKNVELRAGEENQVVIKAYFADGTEKVSEGCFIGIEESTNE